MRSLLAQRRPSQWSLGGVEKETTTLRVFEAAEWRCAFCEYIYTRFARHFVGTSFLGPRYKYQREVTDINPHLTRSLSQHDQLSTSSHRLLCPANSYPMSATLVGTPRYVFAAFTN